MEESEREYSQITSDTIFSVTYRGQRFSSHLKVYEARRLSDLQGFIDSWQSKALTFFKNDSADITGDGKTDHFSTSIKLVNSRAAFIHNVIISDGRTVWDDTLTIDGYLDSLFEELLPISRFYFAVSDWDDFLHEPGAHLTVPGIMLPSADSVFWNTYLSSFSGRLIYKLSPVLPDTYIWDKKNRKFVMYYAP